MAQKELLFIIDPQRDFTLPTGSLFVPGADKDMSRLARFVEKRRKNLSGIVATLDSHHTVDVGHPSMWMDSKGNRPVTTDPKTGFPSPVIITVSDLENGRWVCRFPNLRPHFISYAKTLEAKGNYPLIVWPEHCLIGSEGCAVHPELFQQLREWCTVRGGTVDWYVKGDNPKVEHYSIFEAEVPDPNDPASQFNGPLAFQTLGEADVIFCGGEASTHCVASSIGSILNRLPPEILKKFILFEDCMSPVPGFEQQGLDFLARAKAAGIQVIRSTDY